MRGGGVALIRALSAIRDLKGANEDQNHGIAIALRAMEAPLREIVTNCGDEPSVVLNRLAEGKDNFGYNAATGVVGRFATAPAPRATPSLHRCAIRSVGDMIAMGIPDPTKVARFALQNAASFDCCAIAWDVRPNGCCAATRSWAPTPA